MHKVIERILNLLAFLLTVGRPVTAEEIRNTVAGYDQPSDEAFRRTFERDKDLLRSLGVPLTTTHTDIWEVELGYVVPTDEYTLPDPELTDEERRALAIASEAVRFGGRSTELDAIFKLGGASPAAAGPISADLGHDLESLGILFEAVSAKRNVAFTYRDRRRKVSPYGLVHRFGHWYIVGPERTQPDVTKAFRVDRMDGLEIGDSPEAFERPSDFDPSKALDGVAGTVPTAIARIRFDNDIASVAMARWRDAVVVEEDDTTTVVDVPYDAEGAVINWLIGLDDRAVIEGPHTLASAFVGHVRGSGGE